MLLECSGVVVCVMFPVLMAAAGFDYSHSSNTSTTNSESSSTPGREQICVDSKLFLLLCGALAVILTLATALCCITISLKRRSRPPEHSADLKTIDVLYAEVDFCRKRKRNGSEGEPVDSAAAIYSEVAEEMNRGTGNGTFTTYGLN